MNLQIVLTFGLFLLILAQCILKTEKTEKPSIKEYGIIFILFTVMMFAFMWWTGVFSSEYHFVDDHEVYTIGKDFSEVGFWGTMQKWLSNDLHSRFRFTYFLIRVTECFLVGDHFFIWHIIQTLVSAFSLFLSYIFARKMQCPTWMAYIFSIVIFIGGGQSAVFWRLGPQENWGILLLMLTLICLCNYAENSKVGNFIKVIFMTVLLGGIKEAFLLILPLLPVWLVYWKIRKKDETVNFYSISTFLKKYRIYFLSTYCVFIVDILIILLYTGTNKYGYAGVDFSYEIRDYIREIYWAICGRIFPYIKATIWGFLFLLIPIAVCHRNEPGKLRSFLRKMIIPMLSFSYLLGVQFVLHAKSGLYERYLLPTTFVFAFFWMIDIFYVLNRQDNRYRGYYHMFIILMALMLFGSVNDEERAVQYAEDGKNTTAMMEAVAEYVNEYGDINIVVGLDYEMDFSASVYLQEKYDIKTVYNLFYQKNEDRMVYDGYLCEPDEKQAITVDEAQMFVGYPDKITEFMETYGIGTEEFDRLKFGEYTIFY